MCVKMLFAALCVATLTSSAQAQFNGTFEFRWLTDPNDRHRNMSVLSDVSFTDAAGKNWAVPAGAIIDGASIPAVLWTYAGSPFVGNYRRASVIHDYFCEVSSSGGNDIHRMFREAMLADGVGWIEAGAKYLAVLSFGATPLGKCGKKISALETYQKNFTDPEYEIRADVQAFLQFVQAEVSAGNLAFDKDADKFNDFSVNLLETVDLKAPLTYKASVAYRLEPSLEQLANVEAAIREEQPSELELEQAMLLAVATVPEPLN